MANCELCGMKPIKYSVEIEGTTMLVCEDCSHFGKIKGIQKSQVKIIIEDHKRPESKDPDYIILPGYGSMGKKARERSGLKQEEMAKKLNERESLLHQIESEHFKPGYLLAKKLEKMLHIRILEELKEDKPGSSVNLNTKKESSGAMTLGDMMGGKKR
jgi:putative transcription factor